MFVEIMPTASTQRKVEGGRDHWSHSEVALIEHLLGAHTVPGTSHPLQSPREALTVPIGHMKNLNLRDVHWPPVHLFCRPTLTDFRRCGNTDRPGLSPLLR